MPYLSRQVVKLNLLVIYRIGCFVGLAIVVSSLNAVQYVIAIIQTLFLFTLILSTTDSTVPQLFSLRAHSFLLLFFHSYMNALNAKLILSHYPSLQDEATFEKMGLFVNAVFGFIHLCVVS